MALRLADTLGMRQVSWVRVRSTGEGMAAEAVGVGHRLPRTTRITLAQAARLASQGVRVVFTGATGDTDERR